MRALPGGFIEPHESAEQAALRELFEETGTTDVAIKQLGSFSDPDRDPRTRIITIAFTAQFLNGKQNVKAGDDAAAADWFDITVTPEKHTPTTAAGLLTRYWITKSGFPARPSS
jgi:8-oxo-dGTP diphosphatase